VGGLHTYLWRGRINNKSAENLAHLGQHFAEDVTARQHLDLATALPVARQMEVASYAACVNKRHFLNERGKTRTLKLCLLTSTRQRRRLIASSTSCGAPPARISRCATCDGEDLPPLWLARANAWRRAETFSENAGI